MTGKKFNYLTVLSYAGKRNGRTTWNCLCDCGKEVVVLGSSLKSGNTKACGCHQKDGWINYKTHGKSKTRIYRIWQNMKNRCSNNHDKYYKNYGGRGITVCDEWLHNFQLFYDWSVSNGYKDDLTLDRMNNNGNYCPENCRWASRTEQMNNMRANRILEYNGEKKTMAQWAEVVGIPRYVINSRINNYGWSIKDALEIPIQKRGGRHDLILHRNN